MSWFADTEDSLLRATSFLVATRATNRSIELVLVERLLESESVHHADVLRDSVTEGSDPVSEPVLIDVRDES